RELLALPFVQAEKWRHITGSIAVLGKKSSNGLCGMIRTQYQTAIMGRDVVLCLHPFPSLGVSFIKSGKFLSCSGMKSIHGSIHGGFNIYRKRMSRIDKA